MCICLYIYILCVAIWQTNELETNTLVYTSTQHRAKWTATTADTYLKQKKNKIKINKKIVQTSFRGA